MHTPSSSDWDPLLGRKSLRPAGGFGRVKGNLFTARPWYVRERWGEVGIERLRAALCDEVVELIDSPPAVNSWVEYEHMIAIDRVIADTLMDDHHELVEFGAAIARRDLARLYAHLLKLVTSFAFMLKRVQPLYKLYFQGGSVLRSTISERKATVVLSGDAIPRYQCHHGVIGWWTATAEHYGVADSNVTHVECLHDGGAQCRWTMVVR